MRLTQQSDYALRVLIYAATAWPERRLVSIDEISRAYAISHNHLMKVVHRLSQLGWLQTRRGRGGGLELARAPEAIRLGEVVRTVEEDFELVQCFSGNSDCPLMGMCGLASALEEARDEFFAALDRHTLKDTLPQLRAAPGARRVQKVMWRHEAATGKALRAG